MKSLDEFLTYEKEYTEEKQKIEMELAESEAELVNI